MKSRLNKSRMKSKMKSKKRTRTKSKFIKKRIYTKNNKNRKKKRIYRGGGPCDIPELCDIIRKKPGLSAMPEQQLVDLGLWIPNKRWNCGTSTDPKVTAEKLKANIQTCKGRVGWQMARATEAVAEARVNQDLIAQAEAMVDESKPMPRPAPPPAAWPTVNYPQTRSKKGV